MTITTRKIQNVLRTAGHCASKKERYSLSTTGYMVETVENGSIRVSHIVSAIVSDEARNRMAAQALRRYSKTLIEAGYVAQMVEGYILVSCHAN